MALEEGIILRTDNSCTGTEAYLHEVNWHKHVDKRPELSDKLQAVRATVEDPDFVLRDDEGTVFKYRQGLGTGKTAKLRLVVIEEPDDSGSHYIKTAYFTLDIVEAEPICVSRLLEVE